MRPTNTRRTSCILTGAGNALETTRIAAAQQHEGWIRHLAHAGAWCFKRWPAATRGRRRRHERRQAPHRQRGDHTVVNRSKGGWRCLKCKREAWTDSGLIRRQRYPCNADAAEVYHPSHSLHATQQIVWCARCGAHTTRFPRALKMPCVGSARSDAYRTVINRLASGSDPSRRTRTRCRNRRPKHTRDLD